MKPRKKNSKNIIIEDLKIRVFEGVAKKYEQQVFQNTNTEEIIIIKDDMKRNENNMNMYIGEIIKIFKEIQKSISTLINHLVVNK